MTPRCCGQWSYRQTADTLEDLCHVRLSPTTIGEIADAVAVELAPKLANHSGIREAFQKAKGQTESFADGTSIHIRNAEGKAEWKEGKVGVFVKREQGASALPSEWNTRHLPQPTAVSAFALIGNKSEFQERYQQERRRLGVGSISSTVADGAAWLWGVFRAVFGKTDECLDIFHAAEHISDCGKVLYRKAETSTVWFERMRLVLLSEGFAGMERELSALLLDDLKEEEEKKEERKAVESLFGYLRSHSERLNYRERLLAGRVIGSGQVEGACKNLVGRRMKQTGACWRQSRANRMLYICSLLYSDQWKYAWNYST
jgi:hypothetical protein